MASYCQRVLGTEILITFANYLLVTFYYLEDNVSSTLAYKANNNPFLQTNILIIFTLTFANQ